MLAGLETQKAVVAYREHAHPTLACNICHSLTQHRCAVARTYVRRQAHIHHCRTVHATGVIENICHAVGYVHIGEFIAGHGACHYIGFGGYAIKAVAGVASGCRGGGVCAVRHIIAVGGEGCYLLGRFVFRPRQLIFAYHCLRAAFHFGQIHALNAVSALAVAKLYVVEIYSHIYHSHHYTLAGVGSGSTLM